MRPLRLLRILFGFLRSGVIVDEVQSALGDSVKQKTAPDKGGVYEADIQKASVDFHRLSVERFAARAQGGVGQSFGSFAGALGFGKSNELPVFASLEVYSVDGVRGRVLSRMAVEEILHRRKRKEA